MKKNIITLAISLFTLFTSIAYAHDFQGRHVFGELYGVDAALLDDAAFLEATLKQGIIKSGATYCGTVSEKFDPHGVTILILIAESHVSIHTYPEHNSIFFDAFTCGDCDPMIIAQALIEAIKPHEQHLQVLERGK